MSIWRDGRIPEINSLGQLIGNGGKPGEQFGGIFPGQSGTSMDAFGLLGSPAFIDDASSVGAVALHGSFFQQDTSAIINNQASIACSTRDHWRIDSNFLLISKIQIPTLTNVRLFCGMHTGATATVLGSDDPALDYAGSSFSTGRPDITWKFATEDTAQDLGESGVTATTGVFVFVMDFPLNTLARLRVFDGNGGLLVGEAKKTVQLPPITTGLGFTCGIETLSAAVRSIRHFGHFTSLGVPR